MYAWVVWVRMGVGRGGEDGLSGCCGIYNREAEDFKVRINGNAEFKNIIKKYRIVLLVRI